MQVITDMKRKVLGKDPDEESKGRTEVGNDNSWASMFAKQQKACDLNKAQLAYNAQLQKGKEVGIDKALQTGHKTTHIPGYCRFSYTVCDECLRRAGSSTISRLHHH
jgi:hypothetical protein